MPTIEENKDYWNNYDWGDRGDEWSKVWGSTDVLWSGTLWPRLRSFLPATNIVEIAPGYGRISNFLKDYCSDYVGIDLSERCVTACRERFAAAPHMRFQTTEGTSLPRIESSSIDFVFSFDSLVHADAGVLQAYVEELARVLRPDASAVLHHSNLGAFIDHETGDLTVENKHWRDPTMSATKMRDICRQADLQCRLQEIVNWGGPDLTDCFSVIALRPGSPNCDTRIVENRQLMDEAIRLAKVMRVYDAAACRPGDAASR